MATTVKESFKQFASNLNITDRQESIVSNCHTNVVAKLKESLSLYSDKPSKLIGSYDRDTLTKYLSEGDVDLMVILHYGNNKEWDSKEGVANSLNRFKKILQDAYPKTACHIDRNCVTMKLTEFRLDVIPAFYYKQGYYTIPDTYRGEWLKTDPVKFAEEVTRINKNMDGDFVPLIKMIKGWNRNFTQKLRGFHIECILLNNYKNYSQTYTLDSMVNIFFSKLPTYLDSPTYDPISGDRVDLYLDNNSLGNKRELFVNRANKAASIAQEAYSVSEKDPSVAIAKWKELLGEFFPTYG